MTAVIFDMDGVLIDSEPHWHVAEIEVFGSVGVSLTVERCLETTGLRTDAIVDYWFSRHPWTGPSKRDVARRVQERVRDLVILHGTAIDGSLELVASLHALGVPLAVCSSSPRFLIEATCKKLGILGYFRVLQSAEDCPRGKPHPDPYLATAERLGVGPATCVVVEDSINGMRSARAAGMRVVGISSDPAARADGLCDLVCPSLPMLGAGELLALLQGAASS
jgi:mannitol-1-/sugar-/sorbitol-6-/2-deoxyglucose-6-phosphatase